MKIAGYYESWSMPWTSDASESELATIEGYDTIIVAFMRPDTTYAGGLTFEGTGLQFCSDPTVIKDAIQALRTRGVKVLLAVGGATYHNWDGLNPYGIAAFVSEFGLDGVDIDFEPMDPACTTIPGIQHGTVYCQTDGLYIAITRALRDALPCDVILTSATWSVGAYGEGPFAHAAPQYSPYTGVALNMLRAVGHLLDRVHVMSYDAGDSYDPEAAFEAYRMVVSPADKLLMGIQVPPDAAGGHCTTIEEVSSLCAHVKNGGGGGVFVWSIQKKQSDGYGGLGAADIVHTARRSFA